MKITSFVFFIGCTMSMIPNPLSSGNNGRSYEYKRSIIPGLGMDGDEAREIIEFKRSFPQRRFNKLGLYLNRRDNKDYIDQDYYA